MKGEFFVVFVLTVFFLLINLLFGGGRNGWKNINTFFSVLLDDTFRIFFSSFSEFCAFLAFYFNR